MTFQYICLPPLEGITLLERPSRERTTDIVIHLFSSLGLRETSPLEPL